MLVYLLLVIYLFGLYVVYKGLRKIKKEIKK